MLKNATLLTKILVGVGSAAVLTAVIVVLVNVFGKDAYRQIGVYDIEGRAEIERSSTGVMDAYVNMQLQSEDKADTKEESYMQLKLDEDKYILLDPLTKIELIATGNSEDSKTRIELREGAIVNRIEAPLSDKSTYEVNTPNSTMSVRGTVFRVEVWTDENGLTHTLLSVIEGTVVSDLHDADGKSFGDIREFHAGEEAHMVEGSTESYYVGDSTKPELSEWMLEELKFIGILFDYKPDADTFITKDELNAIIEVLEEGTPLGDSIPKDNDVSDNDKPVREPETEPKAEPDDTNNAPAFDDGASNDTSGNDPAAPAGESNSESSDDDDDDDSSTPPSTTPATYTVTYDFTSGNFGYKEYNEGDIVQAPSIKPSTPQNGHWIVSGGTYNNANIEYESVPVTEDMLIIFK